jgi:hypothetical protein
MNHVQAPAFWLLASFALAAGCSPTARSARPLTAVQSAAYRQSMAEAVVGTWTGSSALAARRLIDQYGPPDEVFSDRLIWNDNAPWKRTIVWQETPLYVPGDPTVIEQTVRYPMTPEEASLAVAFSKDLRADAAHSELSSRAAREELNILNLNLANEVITAGKAPVDAQAAYSRILALEASGKSSPYMAGLLFSFDW